MNEKNIDYPFFNHHLQIVAGKGRDTILSQRTELETMGRFSRAKLDYSNQIVT